MTPEASAAAGIPMLGLRDQDGAWRVTPVPDQDSSLVRMLANAGALIIRPPHAPAAGAGEPCQILRFEALGA